MKDRAMSAAVPHGLEQVSPEFMDEADKHASDSVLQCYWREIADPNELVTWMPASCGSKQHYDCKFLARIALPFTGLAILASVDRKSNVGIRHIDAISLETPNGATPLNRSDLTKLVVEELAQRFNRPVNNELLVQMGLSAQVTAWILSVMPPSILNLADPSSAYVKSEQSLAYGHPFHPTPKARSGIEPAELHLYSPEAGASFQLHYFAVRNELVSQDSCLVQSAGDLTAADGPRHLLPDEGWTLVPVHPWQARYLQQFDGIKKALQEDQMRYLGAHGKYFYPTASVRTLYSADSDYFYKMSLSFRITNCLRRNALPELAASLRVNRMMAKLRPLMLEAFPRFNYLDELAFLTVELPFAPVEEQKAITEGFGMMLRRTIDTQGDTVPLLAAALFGNSGRGRSMMRQLMLAAGLGAEPSDDEMVRWFSAYVEALVPPLLYLYSRVGIMFEPHLQNIVVGFKNGWPTEIYLRDFENARIVAERISAEFTQDLSTADKSELYYSETKAWKRFAYCLFSNHLVEAVRHLSFGRPALEPSLWRSVESTVVGYLAKYGESAVSPMLRELLEGEPLPAKTNLITRVLVGKDAEASYVPIGSPVAVIPLSSLTAQSTDIAISMNA